MNNILSNLPKYIVIAVLVGGVFIAFGKLTGVGNQSGTLNLTIPTLSATAAEGKILYEESCAACHGLNTAGTDQGPTFIHRYYVPNHHSDEAFVLAARNGVRAHHWGFGNMPPRPEVSEEDVRKITRYVREMQEANGIF